MNDQVKESKFKFYAVVKAETSDNVKEEVVLEASKKGELFEMLKQLNNPEIVILVKGRKLELKQKVSYKL